MGKIEEFAIHVNSSEQVFHPGEILDGYVVLNLRQPMDTGGIRIKLSGKGHCYWTEGDSDNYFRKETLINEITLLFGSLPAEQSQRYSHPGGRQTYAFSFTLPTNIPSSFEGDYGYIRYALKAIIDKPWKIDHKVKRLFPVKAIIDTNLPMYKGGTGGEKHKNIGCMCYKAGLLDMTVNIDRSCYCPGEVILVNANVTNHTTRDMQSMHAKLIQTVIYHAAGKSRKSTKVYVKLNGPRIKSGKSESWENKHMRVPTVSPNITNSHVITVHYEVQFVVTPTWGSEAIIKIPVIIGTVPYMTTYDESAVEYCSPQDQREDAEDQLILEREDLPRQLNIFCFSRRVSDFVLWRCCCKRWLI